MKIVSFCIALAAVTLAAASLAVAASHAPELHYFLTGQPVDVVTAMGMMVPLNARARGVFSVRADGNLAILNELKKTFEDFKAEHSKELADLKKGMGDVVQSEKVDRINAEIGKLQKSIDEVNAAMVAAKLGGNDVLDPDKRAYATAFDKFFRKGVDAGLSDLAVKAAASSSSDPDGGYTVPEAMESTIDRVLSTVSAMRGIAGLVTISTSTYKKLIGQGGTGGGWVGEKTARPETNTPRLSELVFPVMELYANPAATQNLLDDSAVNIEDWLASEVSIYFAEQEGAAFISGDGVNKPRGLLSYTTVLNSSWSWGNLGHVVTGAASDFHTEDSADALIDLIYSLKSGYRQNARFLMNRNVQAKIRKFKDDQDNYLWQPGIVAGQPATLLGYPIIDDDNMSDVGSNAYPVAFGDFSRGYLIVDRQGVRVLRDPYTNKPYVHFYTTKRVGGGVQNFEAIKLLKCST
jgi:HK97 family phage major capsid protein